MGLAPAFAGGAGFVGDGEAEAIGIGCFSVSW